MKVAQDRKLWLVSTAAYSISGALSAAATGAAVGWLGRWLGGRPDGGMALGVVAVVGLVLAAREWGLVSFPLPRPRRQTEKFWVHEFGWVLTSILWGLHIGIAFATQVRHGGFWLIAVAALVFGDPAFAAALLVAYWFGRVLSVWLAPHVLTREGLEPEPMVEHVRNDTREHSTLQAVTLAWSAGVAAVAVLAGAGKLSALGAWLR